jgi:RHS repeat-associated protein
VNGLNQYTTSGTGANTATFAYDDNGNLTSSASASGTDAYLYDVENRLVSISGAHEATLAYDPLGRLWQKTSGGVPRAFLYDGDALVAEYDAAGAVVRRHVHNVGADVPMVTYEGADLSNPRWLYADRQGSIVAIAGTDGVPVINRYDEYGIPAASNGGRFGYTGQVWLPEVGLYYYKARFYSPTLGRFLQTDPVGYQGGNNLYGYVGDDPVNRTDPSGNCFEDLCIGEGAVAACLASQGCTFMAVAVGSGVVYYGGRLLGAIGNAISGSSGDSGNRGALHNEDAPEFTDIPGARPHQGEPGSTVRGPRGSRTYGPDGYPETDRDSPHNPGHPAPGNDDHVHDWTRPPDGGPPRDTERGPSRPPRRGDPPRPRGNSPMTQAHSQANRNTCLGSRLSQAGSCTGF